MGQSMGDLCSSKANPQQKEYKSSRTGASYVSHHVKFRTNAEQWRTTYLID